ncbi:MAG: alkaline shock response membrane anchor protein AmaP [Clostridia bacterium]|nr:alkaline shock response membrane anchor protein AmaP [Clostridia bacterium]MCR5695056.1 alkaline shock response membrane anchor protein AmaP [Clostridia bacterium]
MNTFFRITVAIYAFISTVIFAVVMISPFGEKKLMSFLLERAEINLYQSNRYDVLVFIIGLVFVLVSIAILSSGIRGKRSSKYISRTNDGGTVNISAASIENIALAMSKRFQGVKDAKAKALFNKNELSISIKLQAYTDVNLPELCKGIQERVKESVESSTDIKVNNVTVNVENVSQQGE